ncbi:MAG: orotidine 5'-phosphate decarboxylase [Candidatus Liptonbacteria bacterium]|nr:orotidine 5'-phosphate decarboxylase [Candidatus Liptonbacteria bacterium]
MAFRSPSLLNPKRRYLQVAMNGTLGDAAQIIRALPQSNRIIIEAGTPLIKRYGAEAIYKLNSWWTDRLGDASFETEVDAELSANPVRDGASNGVNISLGSIFREAIAQSRRTVVRERNRTASFRNEIGNRAYIVADLKTIDRGETEVALAAEAGASAVIAMGSAPTETLNAFIAACEAQGVDAMLDMMNVEYPLAVLRQLKKVPPVVILHRGVDEERDNREKQIPYHEIQRIKGNYDILLSIAGGDTSREIQRAIFNGADIAVIWKSVYQSTAETIDLVERFLKEVR